MSTSNPIVVTLRSVHDDDLEHFYAHQADAEACRVASFESRGREAFFDHWKRILRDRTGMNRTIVLANGDIAGNVVCWGPPEKRLIGYWVGREFWGRGIATAGLRAFLPLLPERELFAYVARTNPRSIRVLEKAGFVLHEELEDLLFRYRQP